MLAWDDKPRFWKLSAQHILLARSCQYIFTAFKSGMLSANAHLPRFLTLCAGTTEPGQQEVIAWVWLKIVSAGLTVAEMFES